MSRPTVFCDLVYVQTDTWPRGSFFSITLSYSLTPACAGRCPISRRIGANGALNACAFEFTACGASAEPPDDAINGRAAAPAATFELGRDANLYLKDSFRMARSGSIDAKEALGTELLRPQGVRIYGKTRIELSVL